ncbi:hypothetical protein EON78_04315 [bacterium]|nr:MAG: hypothetical protein EON78_04315 [bacterium]
MTNVNSAQGANRFQLEPLDSVRARSNTQVAPNNYQNNDSAGLQPLDSLVANSYNDPNMNIPADANILAPIDAMNPEMPGVDRLDTKEQGATGFIGGVFKGFGKAGLDTVKGVATLGKIVLSSISHPKAAINYVGGGIKYAINNPIQTAKTVAIDLPIGIVKGIVDPYASAVKSGKYGEAVGRGVFDVGMILLTAGIGESTPASQGAGAIEKVGKGSSKGARAIESIVDNADMLDDVAGAGTKVVTKGVEGGIRIGKDAIKVGNVTGDVIINIGNTTANVTAGSSRASRAAQILAQGGTESVAAAAATESIARAGKISLGLGDLGSTLGRGASKLGKVFKPIGTGATNVLTAVVGDRAAAIISQGAATLGQGLSVGGKYVKVGVGIAKAHPVASALIVGKTVDIIDKGLKSSDNYDPGNIK